MSFFHLHAHSQYSCLDGMPKVPAMVERVDALGHLGLGITDHGNMAASLQLYKACKAAGIAAFPGEEFYAVQNLDKTSKRYHLCIAALDFEGYKGLVQLSSLTHHRKLLGTNKFSDGDHFYFKPRLPLSDLWKFGQEYGDHVVITTGCYFGLVPQTLINSGEKAALAIAKKMAKNFPNMFVEIQHHNTEHSQSEYDDTSLAIALYQIAEQVGRPPIITQDAHYCEPTDKSAHEMMKRIVMYSGDEDDVIFPGDSYHLSTGKWVHEHFTDAGIEHIWDAAKPVYDELLDANRLRLPAIDKYKFFVPKFDPSPMHELTRLARHGMEKRYFDIMNTYDDRFKFEMNVIMKMGMSDYFLIIADICREARKRGIMVEARGSANGSLVCYCLDITSVDPVEWDLSFDRFLSLDRAKPPDIDLDIERDRRWEMIEYASQRFGTAMPIGTLTTLGEDQRTGRGSIFVKYLSYKRKSDPDFPGVDQLRDLDELEPEDSKTLRKLADMRVRTSFGVHAAGLVLTTGEYPLEDYIPTCLVASSGTRVTQMEQDDVEDAGFMKVDMLGAAALSVCAETLRLIGKDPITDGFAWIKNDDPDACKLLREGRTETGIFQFEGYSTAKGGKEMKVKSTKDAIICLALYRPAAMASGQKDDYLYYRGHKSEIEYLSPMFKRVLQETHGVFVFQEQVTQIFTLLGMSNSDWNDMLKAIKASNERIAWAETVFERIRPVFKGLCMKQGMTPMEAKEAWEMVMGFSDYGFNRAHATGYGLRSYRMAYLKAHYPLEFMAALLQTWAGTKKEPQVIAEARRLGISLLRPDVNLSDVSWTLDRERGALRKGLLSIKGIGEAVAEELVSKRPFKSVESIVKKCDAKKVSGGKEYMKTKNERDLAGKLAILADVGALTSVGIKM